MIILLIIYLFANLVAVIIKFILEILKRKFPLLLWNFIEYFNILVLPLLFIYIIDIKNKNQCCGDSCAFSPDYRISLYFLIFVSIFGFLKQINKTRCYTPILELLSNFILIFGLILNGIIAYHINKEELGSVLNLLGSLPITLVYLIKIYSNFKIIIKEKNEKDNGKILFLTKYTFLNIFLIAPFLLIYSSILYLIGQKPDAYIKAFTETYHYGFSELDYLCQNIECGGHFLCSVGANGHKNIVKPVRYGFRNKKLIICTRQLLISNAFEEILYEKFPKIHNIIRKNYNKIGDKIHKYYSIFEIKIVSDIIYFLMKPLEIFFLITIYILDRKPENRINKQYLK